MEALDDLITLHIENGDTVLSQLLLESFEVLQSGLDDQNPDAIAFALTIAEKYCLEVKTPSSLGINDIIWSYLVAVVLHPDASFKTILNVMTEDLDLATNTVLLITMVLSTHLLDMTPDSITSKITEIEEYLLPAHLVPDLSEIPSNFVNEAVSAVAAEVSVLCQQVMSHKSNWLYDGSDGVSIISDILNPCIEFILSSEGPVTSEEPFCTVIEALNNTKDILTVPTEAIELFCTSLIMSPPWRLAEILKMTKISFLSGLDLENLPWKSVNIPELRSHISFCVYTLLSQHASLSPAEDLLRGLPVLLICVVFEDVMEKCLEVGTFSRVTTLLKRVASLLSDEEKTRIKASAAKVASGLGMQIGR
eukprot:TRINITY_DN33315_c0_g1_i1.p1 TRINITY_DN33315_c0_g1~~TRINITY_DN33315_c0_g1_i1.p1  ORF type:complete len:373 (+),score=37.65 TRINITY_DN33315_c0_g1_i1:29-1120(+)